MPSSGTSAAPGRICGVRVVAVGGPADAVAVGVALDLLAGHAVSASSVIAVSLPDAQSTCSAAAVARDDVVVARAAVERVDAAAAEQAVVAVAAVEEDRERDGRADRRRRRRRRRG